MRVLVTGAAGLLGRHIVDCLTGHTVVAHDRHVGDLASLDHVRSIVDSMDAVVHAAAIPSPADTPDNITFGNNVNSAYNVLDTAARAGVPRIVNISSLSALGFAWSQRGVSPLTVPVTEDHPYVGDDAYGLSKQVGETVAAATSRRWDTTIVSLRFPFLGTGERLRDHLAPIHADPGADRGGLWAWLDIRDAARAVEAALTVPLSGHHVVHVTAPDTTALVPTMDLVRRYHPTAVVSHELGGFESVFAGDRARDLLGFTPRYGWRAP